MKETLELIIKILFGCTLFSSLMVGLIVPNFIKNRIKWDNRFGLLTFILIGLTIITSMIWLIIK